MFAMKRALPKGIISFWYGNIASIPSGWTLCDGNNGTPDLRDRFVVGAKQDEGGVAKTNVTGALTQTGGAKNHYHNFSGSGHSHTFAIGQGIAGGVDRNTVSDTVVVSGSTNIKDNLDPYYALAYIMKL